MTAVSFMAEGREQTVQVVDNFWIYEGENSATESLTFHLADGSTHTTTHFRRDDGTTGTTIDNDALSPPPAAPRLRSSHERPRAHGPEPDRVPPHRRRAHVPLQLALRAPARR